MKHQLLVLLSVLILVLSFGAVPLPADEAVQVAGVQLEINTDLYRSEEAFLQRADARIASLMKEQKTDLVVFPEYSGVFFAFFGLDFPRNLQAGGMAAGLEFLKREFGSESLEDFFLTHNVRPAMDRIWGSLARRYSVYILGGSFFAPFDGPAGPELRNRTLLYAPDGRVLYRQDKVYPTPFEREILGISPGRLSDARLINLEGRQIGITLCNDTFFEAWEGKFRQADLWIDIKANGVLFDSRQAELFLHALPERIRDTAVPYGMTVCLTGTFFDLLWEGPSSVVTALKRDAEGYPYLLERAGAVRGPDLVRLALP